MRAEVEQRPEALRRDGDATSPRFVGVNAADADRGRRSVLNVASDPHSHCEGGKDGGAPKGKAPEREARALAPEEHPNEDADSSAGETRAPATPDVVKRFATQALKLAATALILAAAALAAVMIWRYYVTAPWTRDGRMRVQVASVAPQVSGQITELKIVDNQFVHKDDVLYIIDPFDFQVSLASAKTQVKMKAADLQVKYVQAERRQHLSNLATTPEEQQQYVGDATQAQAAFDSAQEQEAQAEVNLKRTEVRSPVNGFVTNLLMRVGDYAKEGTANVSVIDADSYWVDGYFEETKMARVCVGDRAEAELMGYPAPILGRVQTITRGISVSDAEPSTQGLPNVDPVYTWVRLAQRVPVRIQITDVPPGVPLVSGMTATVSVGEALPAGNVPWWRKWLGSARDGVADLVHRPAPRSDCIPVLGGARGAVERLPALEPSRRLTPAQINPGLTPGMALPPQPRKNTR